MPSRSSRILRVADRESELTIAAGYCTQGLLTVTAATKRGRFRHLRGREGDGKLLDQLTDDGEVVLSAMTSMEILRGATTVPAPS